jgi:hypothetical protein
VGSTHGHEGGGSCDGFCKRLHFEFHEGVMMKKVPAFLCLQHLFVRFGFVSGRRRADELKQYCKRLQFGENP